MKWRHGLVYNRAMKKSFFHLVCFLFLVCSAVHADLPRFTNPDAARRFLLSDRLFEEKKRLILFIKFKKRSDPAFLEVLQAVLDWPGADADLLQLTARTELAITRDPERLLNHPNWHVREEIASQIRGYATKKPPLMEKLKSMALEDPHEEVRMAAAYQLGVLSRKNPELAGFLEPHVSDPVIGAELNRAMRFNSNLIDKTLDDAVKDLASHDRRRVERGRSVLTVLNLTNSDNRQKAFVAFEKAGPKAREVLLGVFRSRLTVRGLTEVFESDLFPYDQYLISQTFSNRGAPEYKNRMPVGPPSIELQSKLRGLLKTADPSVLPSLIRAFLFFHDREPASLAALTEFAESTDPEVQSALKAVARTLSPP
jgi:hypothetical protein